MIEAMIQEARAREAQRALIREDERREAHAMMVDKAKYALLGELAFWLGEEACVEAEFATCDVYGWPVLVLPVNGDLIRLKYERDRDGSFWKIYKPRGTQTLVRANLFHKDKTTDNLLLALGRMAGL